MKEEKIVSLDALRGLAAFAVAVPHFAMAEQYGVAIAEAIASMAVEVFFILSGFVLAPQILYCFEDDSVRRFEIFLARRWMRTLPLFTLSLYLTAEIHHQFNKHDFYEYLFLCETFGHTRHRVTSFPWHESLAIEEWFYVAFPCFLLVTKRLGLQWRYIIGIYLGFFFVIRTASAVLVPDWNIGAHREVIFRLDAIGFGFLLYYLINVSHEFADSLDSYFYSKPVIIYRYIIFFSDFYLSLCIHKLSINYVVFALLLRYRRFLNDDIILFS